MKASKVYVIIDRKGYLKIGKSDNPHKRVGQLQTGNPLKITLLGWFTLESSEEAYLLEKYLHNELRDKSVLNEWFSCGLLDVVTKTKTFNGSLTFTENIVENIFYHSKNLQYNAIIEEQRAITKECSGNVLPAYLYNYYVSICSIPSWNLSNDALVAKQLGITERKVADTRRLLTKKGWVRFDIHRHNNVTYALWYIGKEVVEAKFGSCTELEEYLALGVILKEEYDAAKRYEGVEVVTDEQ